MGLGLGFVSTLIDQFLLAQTLGSAKKGTEIIH
jgi:hypothetical protein